MPLPTVAGKDKLDRAACEAVWFYFAAAGAIEVSVDGGSFSAATSGTDPNSVASYYRLFAGPDCASPGSATVLTVGRHNVKWRLVASPETHIGTGHITIT